MTMIPLGDYFAWYCDWCDSTNQTHWSRLSRQQLTCAACHHANDVDDAAFGLMTQTV